MTAAKVGLSSGCPGDIKRSFGPPLERNPHLESSHFFLPTDGVLEFR